MQDLRNIYHWRRFDHRLTTSGQPTESQLEDLKQIGVSHIINLGLHEHEKALPDEAKSISDLGMTYIHIPVDFDAPTDQDFQAFKDVFEMLDPHTVHVHCIANLRVTAFLYRYAMETLKLETKHAKAIMDTVWRPGGVWATFIGDAESVPLEHRPPERLDRP